MDEGASAAQDPQQPGRSHAEQRGGLGRGGWDRGGRGGRGRFPGRGWPQRHARAAADSNDRISSWRSRGSNRAQPGVQALLALIPTFRLGIFSSATNRNVASAVAMLEQEAGVGPGQAFEHGLVLHRDHTQQLEGTDQHWYTCKPLSRWFAHLHRVVLIDDDAHKALPQEQRNLVHVPCWEDDDWQGDPLEVLVQALEEVLGPLGPGAYTRQYTERVMQRLAY